MALSSSGLGSCGGSLGVVCFLPRCRHGRNEATQVGSSRLLARSGAVGAPRRNQKWSLRAINEPIPAAAAATADSAGARNAGVSRETPGADLAKDARVSGRELRRDLAIGDGGSYSASGENVVGSSEKHCQRDHGGSGNGNYPPGGGGGGGEGGDGDGGGEDDDKGDEFELPLTFEEVVKELESRGTSLPSDMLEAAKNNELSKDLLHKFFELENAAWPLGLAVKYLSWLRNRMLVDPAFLFKMGLEIVFESFFSTLAEVQKRGEKFWAEFEYFASNLFVGIIVTVVSVVMLAPYQRIGRQSPPKGFVGRMIRAYGSLPSSIFEAERPGCQFSLQQRIGAYFLTGIIYAPIGFVGGIVGQGISNVIMLARRQGRTSDEDVPIPPLLKSSAVWGAFLATSSNTRYQIVNGLERLVESSPVAVRAPGVARAFTFGARAANTFYGGMNFIDWSRWAGTQ